MADLFFLCPHCAKHLVVDDRVAGHGVHCPKCGGGVRVPNAASVPGEAPPSEAACCIVHSEVFREEDIVICKGILRNGSEEPASFVRIEIDWLDEGGNVLSDDWTFAVSTGDLEPGQSVQFAFSTEAEGTLPGYRLRVVRQ